MQISKHRQKPVSEGVGGLVHGTDLRPCRRDINQAREDAIATSDVLLEVLHDSIVQLVVQASISSGRR